MTAFASQLTAHAEILAMELRGHGGTPWDPDTHYGFDDYLDDLSLQLRHWSRRCLLVGCGLGGRIALAAALANPSIVDGLVLIDPDAGCETPSTLVERLVDAASEDGMPDLDLFPGYFWRGIYQELTWAAPGNRRRTKCDPDVLGRVDDRQAWDDASELAQPALILRGESSDGVSEENTLRLVRTMPRAEYAAVPGGRWPHIEAPAQTAAEVAAFLSRLAEAGRNG